MFANVAIDNRLREITDKVSFNVLLWQGSLEKAVPY